MVTEGQNIEISNPDKVLFPESGLTKKQLVDYYALAGPFMLPYLKDRPVAMQRYPEGITGQSFFQKEIPAYFPEYIERVTVKGSTGTKDYAMINNLPSLIYIANQASILLHPWQSRKTSLHNPDQVIWDFDPSVEGFEKIRAGARLIKDFLDELGLPPRIKLTGSKGVHIIIPVEPKHGYEFIKNFSRGVAEIMVAKAPDIFTMEMRKNKRDGLIFLDYLRNGYGNTAVAPYSVRAIENAPVAAPITWKELDDKKIHPQYFTIKKMKARFKAVGDVWEGFYDKPFNLTAACKRLEGLMKK